MAGITSACHLWTGGLTCSSHLEDVSVAYPCRKKAFWRKWNTGTHCAEKNVCSLHGIGGGRELCQDRFGYPCDAIHLFMSSMLTFLSSSSIKGHLQLSLLCAKQPYCTKKFTKVCNRKCRGGGGQGGGRNQLKTGTFRGFSLHAQINWF